MSRYTGMEKQDAQGVDESCTHYDEHKTDTKWYTLYDSIWFRNRQHCSVAVEITIAYLSGD